MISYSYFLNVELLTINNIYINIMKNVFTLVKRLKACNASSSIDPNPLPLLKLIDEHISDHLLQFIRKSFDTSLVPISIKKAFVKRQLGC